MIIGELTPEQKKQYKDFLESLLTEHRLQRFAEVLANRTRYVTVVLEDIFQAHNASAVLRSCDCFGVQDVYFAENYNEYTLSTEVTMGSDKWLNINRFDDSQKAIEKLRNDGYQIVATTPHTKDVEVDNLDLSSGKIALFFGTEHTGLSDTVMQNADTFVRIPMYGFTESYNISVSAALTLYSVVRRLKESNIDWELSLKEKFDIELDWAMKSIRRLEVHDEYFMNQLLEK
ncbi:MAG: TrmH family RNA methyltransferase [Bacteroidales bacterium]